MPGPMPKRKASEDPATVRGERVHRMGPHSSGRSWAEGPGQGSSVPTEHRGQAGPRLGASPKPAAAGTFCRNMAAKKSNTQQHPVDQKNVFWRHCPEDL